MTETHVDPQKWQEISSFLGQDLLNYMLANAGDVQPSDLDEKQREVAKFIVAAVAGANLGEWDSVRRSHTVMQAFCAYEPDLGRSLATALHFQSGGVLPDIESNDELEKTLCYLALDAFPGLLVNLTQEGITTTGHLFTHPLRQQATNLMFSPDEPLMRLFPNADFEADAKPDVYNDMGLVAYTRWSDGSMGTVQFIALAETILRKASGAPQPGRTALESYVASVRQSLRLARDLAARKEVTLIAIAGCPGSSLVDGTSELGLAEGRIRLMGVPERSLVSYATTGTVVIEIPVKLKLEELSVSQEGLQLPTPANILTGQEYTQQVLRNASRARMSILLASNEGETLVTGQSFVSWSNPVSSGHHQIHAPNPWRPSLYWSRPLQPDDEANIRHWETLLAQAPQGLNTGQERLLSAVNERDNPIDGFIDAVIVWENLFGAAGETTLRVCGSLAHVLEPNDADKRLALYKDAKKLYEKRSKLVHGSEQRISHADAYDHWRVSIQHAIAAWRRVLESDHLRDQKTSMDRGIAVLIGGYSG
ncbi:HEPN domain-containing protein [Paenarthrobacter nicotinovorans]|uniref:HEPN domain-containing protein n=1 Tax=Paenarthrobacter nicotinovorans TaxID=29320 RepID=UPI002486CA51|nr:HEPN domain-containing protein [Paenarthrobacter nicotinovorans]MDI2019737.1 hypothetical protein [Paenarthrobacter nicotinovorans]